MVSNSLSDDIYRVFETSSKFDLITMIDGDDKRNKGRGSLTSNYSQHSSFETDEEAPEYLELVNISSSSAPPADTATNESATSVAMLQRCEQIKVSLHTIDIHNHVYQILYTVLPCTVQLYYVHASAIIITA